MHINTSSWPNGVVNFFQNERVQSTTFKVITLGCGSILLIITGLYTTGIALPNSFPNTYLVLASSKEAFNILAASSLGIVGLASTTLGLGSMHFKKPNLGKSPNNTPSGTLVSQHNTQEETTPFNDGTIKWGSDQNSRYRRKMEDTHTSQTFTVKGTKVFLGGIFDGHGGVDVACYLQQHIKEQIEKELNKVKSLTQENIECAIRAACAKMDALLARDNVSNSDNLRMSLGYSQGSCAAMILVVGEALLFAVNVGDSRIVLSRNQRAEDLSKDAKAENYKNEITSKGGFVILEKVNGVLEVARAFGDFSITNDKKEKLVTSDPEIRVVNLKELQPDDFVVVACDGVWDVLSSQDVVDVVRSHNDEEEASKEIVRQALGKGSKDNITAGVVYISKLRS